MPTSPPTLFAPRRYSARDLSEANYDIASYWNCFQFEALAEHAGLDPDELIGAADDVPASIGQDTTFAIGVLVGLRLAARAESSRGRGERKGRRAGAKAAHGQMAKQLWPGSSCAPRWT